MNKNAQGLSLNVIIVAIISLLVLVVLSVLLFKHVGETDAKLRDCTIAGGFCVDYASSCSSGAEILETTCPDAKPYCCKRELITIGGDEFE